jgi:beta-lactamase regulating signal transducer with metallopeptidase domain
MSLDLLPIDPRWTGWIAGMLVHAGWIATVAGIAAWAVLVRIRDPHHRHGVGLGALGMIAGGLVIAAVATWPEAPSAPAPVAAMTAVAAPLPPALTTVVAAAPALAAEASVDWQGWAVLVWVVGVALFLLRHGVGHGRILVLRRSAHPAGADLRARVADHCRRLRLPVPMILLSHRIQVPAATGWLRPALLLPISLATALPPAQVEALILHELAHLRRRDALIEAGMSALECLLFFHPALWWLGRQVREAREQCCDQDALGAGAAPDNLARALLAVAEGVVAPPPALAATGGPLTARVRRILGLPERRRLRLRGLLALLLLPVAALAVAACAARGDDAVESLDVPMPVGAIVTAPDRRHPLDRRIRALADPRTLRTTTMIVTGDQDFWARAGVDPDRQQVLTTEVADRLAAAASGEDSGHLILSVVTFPLQRGVASFAAEYAHISDYRVVDGRPDPMITALRSGEAMAVTIDLDDGGGALVTDLRLTRAVLIGTSTAHLRFPGDAGTDRVWPIEEPVQEIYTGVLDGTDVRVPAGHALAVPVRARIVRHRASIRTESIAIREGDPVAIPTRSDHRHTLVLVRTVIDPQPAAVRERLTVSPDAAWFAATTVSLRADAEPLPAVLARLAAQLPVPTALQRDPDTAATRVTIAATDEPLASVLGRLLPQTLLNARAETMSLAFTTPAAGPVPDRGAGMLKSLGGSDGDMPAVPDPAPATMDLLPWPPGREPAEARIYDVRDLLDPAHAMTPAAPGWRITLAPAGGPAGASDGSDLVHRLTRLVPAEALEGNRGITAVAGPGLVVEAAPAVHRLVATALAGQRSASVAVVTVRVDLVHLDRLDHGFTGDDGASLLSMDRTAVDRLLSVADGLTPSALLPGGTARIAPGQGAVFSTTGTGWTAGIQVQATAFPSQDRRHITFSLDTLVTGPDGDQPQRHRVTATVPDGGTILLRTPRRDVALRLRAEMP